MLGQWDWVAYATFYSDGNSWLKCSWAIRCITSGQNQTKAKPEKKIQPSWCFSWKHKIIKYFTKYKAPRLISNLWFIPSDWWAKLHQPIKLTFNGLWLELDLKNPAWMFYDTKQLIISSASPMKWKDRQCAGITKVGNWFELREESLWQIQCQGLGHSNLMNCSIKSLFNTLFWSVPVQHVTNSTFANFSRSCLSSFATTHSQFWLIPKTWRNIDCVK